MKVSELKGWERESQSKLTSEYHFRRADPYWREVVIDTIPQSYRECKRKTKIIEKTQVLDFVCYFGSSSQKEDSSQWITNFNRCFNISLDGNNRDNTPLMFLYEFKY